MRSPMNDKPIADWLRDTRLRQITVKTGEPWTQDQLIDRMHAEIGWAPHRPNYSKYENGLATPRRDTLGKFVRFWALHDEPGPDLTPKVQPLPEPSLPVAIKAQADATKDGGPM